MHTACKQAKTGVSRTSVTDDAYLANISNILREKGGEVMGGRGRRGAPGKKYSGNSDCWGTKSVFRLQTALQWREWEE